MNIECTGDIHAPAKQKVLPRKILIAIDRALDLLDLKLGPRATLKQICKYARQFDPSSAIFTRRCKIAATLGVSDRTVYNHFRILEAQGWIRVEEQRHSRLSGKFLVTHVFLTEKAVRALGFVDDTPLPCPAPDTLSAAAPSEKNAGGYINKKLTEPSVSQKDHGAHAVLPTIPADLQPLLERGMYAKSVCKLMGKATQQGHWLTHVWQSVQQQVDKLALRGMRLMRYLEAAIANGGDFASRANQIRQQTAQQQRQQQEQQQLQQFVEQYAGQVFESADARELIAIDPSGSYALHRIAGVEGTMPLASMREVAFVLARIQHHQLRLRAPYPATAQCEGIPDATRDRSAARAGIAQIRSLLGACAKHTGNGHEAHAAT